MKQQRGFSLIELMVTLAVMAIVLVLAVPSYQSLTQNNRLAAATNALNTALNQARSEAIKTSRLMTVCPRSIDGTDCATGTTDWANGWLVRVDQSECDIATEECVERVWPPVRGGVTFTASPNEVQFRARGNAEDPVQFELQVNTRHRCINVNAVGRISLVSDPC